MCYTEPPIDTDQRTCYGVENKFNIRVLFAGRATPRGGRARGARSERSRAMPLNGAGDGQKLGRLAQVLRAIEVYLRRYDRSPTVRDLCRETGILSTGYVFYLLARLELDGYITREAGVSRSIRLTRPARVPITLTVAPGLPLDPFASGQRVSLYLPAHTR